MKNLTPFMYSTLAIMLMFLLTTCNAGKTKPDTEKNIDSLVDAKVEQRLKEMAIDKEIDKINEDNDFSDEEKNDNSDDFDGNEIEDVEAEDDLDVMQGHIGPYPITMELLDIGDIEEDDYAGYYYYNERPKSKFVLKVSEFEAINAKGSMRLVMKEYTSSGQHSGTFYGQYECRGDNYSGVFINSKGQKFDFEIY